MSSTAEQLALARQQHQAGAIAQAEQIYRRVLASEPGNAEALHLAGVAAHQSGRQADAIELLCRAVTVNPREPVYHNHLGAAYGAAKQYAQAEQSFRESIRLNPRDPQAHYNLAALLVLESKANEAAAAYQEALRLQPNFPEALFNLGNLFGDKEYYDDAIRCYRQALRLRPNYVLALNNLGNAFNTQGRYAEAEQVFRTALEYKPDQVRARNNLAVSLVEQGRFAEALPHYRQLVTGHPDFAEAHNNLGVWHFKQGQFDEAVADYERAIAVNPDYPEAHKNRAVAWLIQADFARGWPEYEWRWKCKDCPPHGYRQPLWDGSPLDGRTILLYAEQGFGDTLQFIRYVPMVKACGGTVVVRVPTPLIHIMRSVPGIDHLCNDNSQLPQFDVQSPLLTLPAIFKTTSETIPADVPYLHAAADLVEYWRRELSGLAGIRIGINWQGKPRSASYRGDVQRAIPLAEFEPLARIPGVQLVSIQKGSGTEQIAEVAERFHVHELDPNFDTFAGAFMDTAAVMKTLDLVITSDTATAHLAGGLGMPVWVALPLSPDWRWLTAGSASRWYPTMRLFRQSTWGDWRPVLAEMAGELTKRVQSTERASDS